MKHLLSKDPFNALIGKVCRASMSAVDFATVWEVTPGNWTSAPPATELPDPCERYPLFRL